VFHTLDRAQQARATVLPENLDLWFLAWVCTSLMLGIS
jgi:hypothetical protein